MLKLKEVKDLINNGVYELLKTYGYEFKRTKNEFVTHTGECNFIYYLTFTNWSSHISITAYSFIRHIEIESTYGKLIGESWKDNWTVGGEICSIKHTPDGKKQINEDCTIRISNSNDIKTTMKTLEGYFLHISLPFFEKYHTIEKIDELYNEPPFDEMPVLVQRTLADQCMKGLIIAKIIKRKNYSQLVKTFDSLINSLDSKQSKEEYEKLKQKIG